MQSPVRIPNHDSMQQGTSLTQQQSMSQKSDHLKARRKLSLNGLWSTRNLLVFIAVMQIIAVVLVILNLSVSPSAILQQIQNQRVISQVAAQTAVNTSETPTVATVTDANTLRGQNAAQAQVYKDAQNGDVVLGYSDKMIIFRQSSNQIIYNGPNPNALVTQTQQKIIDDVTAAAKKQGIITNDSTETPQVSIITDVKSLQATNPTFYNAARNNDIVALFPTAQVIVLYNQDSASIVNSGKYTTSITPQ